MEDQPTQVELSEGELRPILVAADRAALLLSISERTLRKLDSMEQIPTPVRIGRRVLWSVAELEEWVEAGCPPRHRWEIDKQAKRERTHPGSKVRGRR